VVECGGGREVKQQWLEAFMAAEGHGGPAMAAVRIWLRAWRQWLEVVVRERAWRRRRDGGGLYVLLVTCVSCGFEGVLDTELFAGPRVSSALCRE
jgi:hypothetical protein